MNETERQRKADHKARKAKGRAQANVQRLKQVGKTHFITVPGAGGMNALAAAAIMMGDRR